MKTRIIIALSAAFLFILSGCSSNQKSENVTSMYTGSGYTDTEMAKENVAAGSIDAAAVRKIIKNGKLDLDTEDVVKTYADILAFAQENGGYEFSHTQTARDTYTSITAQIKIKPENLDKLMEFAGNSAHVINSTTTSDDITDKYYDAQLRLKTKKEVLENYYKYLDEAQSIQETLQIQDEINRMTEEIEAAEGMLNMWDQLVSESTLDITISQKNDPLKPKKEVNWSAMSLSQMGTMIKNGFISVSNVLIFIIQWILIIAIGAIPILLVAGIVFFATRKKRKELKEKKQTIRAMFTHASGNPSANKPDDTQKK